MQILFLLFFSTTVFCITTDNQKEEKYQEIVKELGLGVKFEIDKHSTKMPEDYKNYIQGSPEFIGNISIHNTLTKDFTTIIKKYKHLLPDNTNDQDDLFKYFNTPNNEDEVRFDKTYSKFISSQFRGFYEIYSFKSKQLVFSENPEDMYTVFAVIKGKTEVKEQGTVNKNQKAEKTIKSLISSHKYKYSIADAIIEAAEAFTYNELSKILNKKFNFGK